MTTTRTVLAALLMCGAAGLCVADETDDAKALLVGKWHIPEAKPLKGQRDMYFEFTDDGKYTFASADKTFKVRKGTYKVTAKDTVEVEVTEGLVKGEKKEKKTVKFEVTKDKIKFDPALGKAAQTYTRVEK